MDDETREEYKSKRRASPRKRVEGGEVIPVDSILPGCGEEQSYHRSDSTAPCRQTWACTGWG